MESAYQLQPGEFILQFHIFIYNTLCYPFRAFNISDNILFSSAKLDVSTVRQLPGPLLCNISAGNGIFQNGYSWNFHQHNHHRAECLNQLLLAHQDVLHEYTKRRLQQRYFLHHSWQRLSCSWRFNCGLHHIQFSNMQLDSSCGRYRLQYPIPHHRNFNLELLICFNDVSKPFRIDCCKHL